jgi:hypothetical protein
MKTMTLAHLPIGEWTAVNLLALFCFVLMLLVGGVLPALAQGTAEQVEITLPEPTGPYSVGRTIYEWTDSNRGESPATMRSPSSIST